MPSMYLLYRYSVLGSSPGYYSTITPVLRFTILSYVLRPRTTPAVHIIHPGFVGLEGFRSPRVVSLLVLALVVSAPAVSSLWSGPAGPDYLGPGDLLPNTHPP
jgi:hypothetical protein